MNHMEEVAKMLGVEIGEEFEIGGWEEFNPFAFTNSELYDSKGNYRPDVLVNILIGAQEIIKKPWVPKDGEIVYHANGDGGVHGFAFYESITYDIAMLALGWYFRTRKEAEARAPKIREQMKRILNGELRAELVEVNGDE